MISISERYPALVHDQNFAFDPAQAALVERLDALSSKLAGYNADVGPSAFARCMGIKPAEPPRGLYIHGPVGRGTT